MKMKMKSLVKKVLVELGRNEMMKWGYKLDD